MPRGRRLQPGDRAGRLKMIARRHRQLERMAEVRAGGVLGNPIPEQLDDLDATAVVGADLESLEL